MAEELPMNNPHRLLLTDIKQLLQVTCSKQPYLRMGYCDEVHPLKGCSMAIDGQGRIARLGSNEQVSLWVSDNKITFERIIDCSKYVAIPGLVDAHTHALFAGDRSIEFDMKLAGQSYVQISQKGYGIKYTAEHVNKATLEQLQEHLNKYLPRISKLGTTTIEIKSGFGLNVQAEIKMLKAIECARLKYQNVITIVATFCGAHAIPKGKTQLEQTADLIDVQIPAIKEAMHRKEISPKFIDVFCERKYFEAESSTRIMLAGKNIGLIPSFHGDELSNLESGTIARDVQAKAVSHLQYISEESIAVMSKHQIVGIMLPTTQNIEKLPIPPIKTMRKHGMILALGSDFCPNAFCYNMFLTCHYACSNYRMKPNEVLAAATINAAYALGLSSEVGSLEQGKLADVLLLDVETWTYFVYQFGDTPIAMVIKEGRVL